MSESLPHTLLEQILREEQHFAQAPHAFFEAWKRGAQIAGAQWFGDGTTEGLQRATDKWELRPNLPRIRRGLDVMTANERLFLAAMVSVYDSHDGGALLRRCRFEGLSDFTCLDLSRRQVIADLVVNYTGW